jgi:protein SCO1/2
VVSPAPNADAPPLGSSAAMPPGVRFLRVALWALLVMMLSGLLAVWWWGTGRRAADAKRLPIVTELPAFSLVDYRGSAVTRETLAGSPWVADLIFTRCVTSCPVMTGRMAALGPALPPQVRRVSVSVDPTHDTPEVFGRYAVENNGGDDSWLFVTGDEAQIQRLARDGFQLGVARTPADDPRAATEPITHSTRFVLVDHLSRVRGYYDGDDPAALEALARDAGALAAAAQRERS